MNDVSKKQAIAVLETLIEFGADPLVKGRGGQSALDCAMGENDPDVLRLMQQVSGTKAAKSMEHKCGATANIMANAAGGSLSELKESVASGGDLNAPDASGRTALHVAAIHGHFEVVGWLLESKCDVKVCDLEGCTPLHLAAEYGHLRVSEALLFHGADIDAKNKQGNTPLNLASREKRDKAVRLLLDNGASIGAEQKEVLRLLHHAVGYNGYNLEFASGRKVTRLLLEHGAEVKEEDPDNPCALREARRRLREVLNKINTQSHTAEVAWERQDICGLPEILDLLDFFAKEKRKKRNG